MFAVVCLPSVGGVLGREGPTLCLCVCLGQVRVFIGFAAVFLPSVGVVLGREGPALCLCVCLGQVRVFIGFAAVFLPSVWGCLLYTSPSPRD